MDYYFKGVLLTLWDGERGSKASTSAFDMTGVFEPVSGFGRAFVSSSSGTCSLYLPDGKTEVK